MLNLKPLIEQRMAFNYAAIRTSVAMSEIPKSLPPLIPEILGWIDKNYPNQQSGPVFFRYLKMSGSNIEVEVGVPTRDVLPNSGRFTSGSMPAGRYATVTYFGDYNRLPQVHSFLDQWGREQGFNVSGNRIEFYPTDPETQPDVTKWQTIVAVEVVA